jgi:hypothetical protein
MSKTLGLAWSCILPRWCGGMWRAEERKRDGKKHERKSVEKRDESVRWGILCGKRETPEDPCKREKAMTVKLCSTRQAQQMERQETKNCCVAVAG